MMHASHLVVAALVVLAIDRALLPAQEPAHFPPDTVRAIVIHPVLRQHFVCLEHPVGQLPSVGDALGADCLVVSLAAGAAHQFPAFFEGDGSQNIDWYGWNQPVLAPFDGVVDSVSINKLTNVPGTLGHSRATVVVFRRIDGVRVLYAHVQGIRVAPGDTVHGGQLVARVGNNGPAKMPHVHVAAWIGTEPLQIRFDLRAMGQLSRQPDPAALRLNDR